ncbi:MAG: fucose isomerase [Caldivirga sp.]|uniref:fucose isomerase n=1 Tax=Caldivirga sp. TaxID=2080243 RepID=UPI003D0A7472
MRLSVFFIGTSKDFVDNVKQYLQKKFPHIEFDFFTVSSINEASSTVSRLPGDTTGVLVFNSWSIPSIVRPILSRGIPTILISDTYGGAGEFLMEYSRALKLNLPVFGIVVRDLSGLSLLDKYVRMLETIGRLRDSKIVAVVGPDELNLMHLEYPLSIDLYGLRAYLQSIFGVKIELVDVRHFNEKYYSKVTDEEAKPIAERWLKNAEKVVDHTIDDLIKPAKLYLALRRLASDYKADAVTMDDIVLYNSGFLDTWPCLPFMELTLRDKIVSICEGDLISGTLMLLMKFYANVPGFINDPAPDMSKGEIVYFHCYAPINAKGFDSMELSPYIITPAHGGGKKLSIHVRLPVNETVTVVGLSPEERILVIHTARAIDNEYHLRACATKLVAKANVEALAKNWVWRAGWHRVVFYGDWRGDLKILARLLGLRIIEEDA